MERHKVTISIEVNPADQHKGSAVKNDLSKDVEGYLSSKQNGKIRAYLFEFTDLKEKQRLGDLTVTYNGSQWTTSDSGEKTKIANGVISYIQNNFLYN